MRPCARARGLVACDAARYRAMACELFVRVSVAVEAETVEPRLDSLLQVCTTAAVACDASVEAPLVDVVVVTGEAVDVRVLVVREIERQSGHAIECRLAENRSYPAWRETSYSYGGNRDDRYDPSCVSPEYEQLAHAQPASCNARRPGAQQHRDRPDGDEQRQGSLRGSADVSLGDDNVDGNQCDEQDPETHVGRLETPVARPQPAHAAD